MELRKLIERCETFFPSHYWQGVAKKQINIINIISLVYMGHMEEESI